MLPIKKHKQMCNTSVYALKKYPRFTLYLITAPFVYHIPNLKLTNFVGRTY